MLSGIRKVENKWPACAASPVAKIQGDAATQLLSVGSSVFLFIRKALLADDIIRSLVIKELQGDPASRKLFFNIFSDAS